VQLVYLLAHERRTPANMFTTPLAIANHPEVVRERGDGDARRRCTERSVFNYSERAPYGRGALFAVYVEADLGRGSSDGASYECLSI